MSATEQLPLVEVSPYSKNKNQAVHSSLPNITFTVPTKQPNETNEAKDAVVKIELDEQNKFLFDVHENPPVPLTLALTLQQAIACLSGAFSVSFLLADIVCARADENLKTRIFCTTLFMSGLCTFLQCTIGIRVPMYQGPMTGYVISLVALTSLPVWRCDGESNDAANITINGTISISTYTRLQRIEGSMMIAGGMHTLIGVFGLTGFLLRFIGPVTIVPTLTLVALYIHPSAVKFAETQWGVTLLTTTTALILSFYLGQYRAPFPWYSRSSGFCIRWFNFHRTFAVMIAVLVGWIASWIITAVGGYDTSPNSPNYYARTDSRLFVIKESKWFIFPYPGQYGPPSFETGATVSFLVTTLASIMDSVGDYYACAKIIDAPPPPKHAVNRGTAVEGFVSFIAGWAGAGHGTTTYTISLAVAQISKVVSLRVFQALGLFLMVLGVCGKVGACFIVIPYPVIGGLFIITIGVFVGIVLSYLEHIDMSSSRNMSIIGLSILLAMMLNYWITTRKNAIETGFFDLDNTLTMLLANPIFVAGVTSCVLDNTMPGTRKERGLLVWSEMLEAAEVQKHGDDEMRQKKLLKTIYVVPYFSKILKRFHALGRLPVCPNFDAKSEN